MLRWIRGLGWSPWLVVLSAALYLALLYLSKPFSTTFEWGCESLVGALALAVIGEVVIGASCTLLKASARWHSYVRMLVSLPVIAGALALTSVIPAHDYHARWKFVAFSVVSAGWYTLLFGWARLRQVKGRG